jgi:hypothetical protein
MHIKKTDEGFETQWYVKPTYTSLILNYEAIAPVKYKEHVIKGMVHRIYNASSSWKIFHNGIEKAKLIWSKNNYPEFFTHKVVNSTLNKIINKNSKERVDDKVKNSTEEQIKHLFVIEYRGKITDDYINEVRKAGAHIKTVVTMRKTLSLLPTLKAPISKEMESNVIYKFECSRCQSTYVGKTQRHLKVRIQEHKNRKNLVLNKHVDECKSSISLENFTIIDRSNKNNNFLLTIEALHIRNGKPKLNTMMTKEEQRNKELRILYV